jgi:lipopolysaccharide export system permease protein
VKIIYKYIIKNFIGPFVLTFFFALFILLMQYLWKYVDDLVGKGLEISIILELLFYASATFVATAAPLAILLSSLMTFGNLGERYEIVAIKSAGIPISKLFIPLLLLSFIIGIFTFWFANNISPKAFLKSKTLLLDIRDTKPALSIEEGVFYDGLDNYVIRIGKKGRDNASIEDVLIYDHSKGQGNTTVTFAKKGEMRITDDKKYMLFTLYNGFFWDESRNSTNSGSVRSKYPLVRAGFKTNQPFPAGYDFYTKKLYDNTELLLNCINYLCADDDLLQIRSKNFKIGTLNPQKVRENSNMYAIINISVPLILITVIGVVLIIFRKRSFSRKKLK